MANCKWWPWVAVALAGIVYYRIQDLALVGLDTLPILHTADFAGFLFERLMPQHRMFRPVLNFTVALDKELYGLEAWGYQVTNALTYLAMGLAVGFAARRLVGTSRAALVAVLALMLHPSLMDVIPAVERRSELLMITFTCLAVGAQVKAAGVPELRGRWAPLTPPLLALLAMGSKDNGVIVLPLLLVTGFLYAEGALGARVRQAFWITGPTFLLTALFLAWRGQLVGGLGGRTDRNPFTLALEHPGQVPLMLDRVLRPEPFANEAPLTGILVALAATLFAVVWFRGRGARSEVLSTPGRAALVGAVWIELAIVVYASRGVWRLWYVALLAAGYALILGAAAEVLFARAEQPRLRKLAVAALVAIALSLGWQSRYTVAFGPMDDWTERSRIMRAFYGELDALLATAEPGMVVICPDLPDKIETPPGPGHYDNVRDVTKTTVRAWCWLHYPELKARLRPDKRTRTREGADWILLVHPTF